MRSKKVLNYRDNNDKQLFKPSLNKPGTLEPDEMYSFAPVLSLGGTASIKNVRKVKILEELSVLCDLDKPILLKATSELA